MKVQKDLVKGAWESYCRLVMPASAPEIQLKECRQAFYAGAAATIHILSQLMDPGEEPTEKDLLQMQALHDELNAFGAALDKRYTGGSQH